MHLRTTAICTALTLALVGLSAQAKDGTYTAVTQGRNGNVTVHVTIANDKIQSVTLGDWSETHPIADLPAKAIPENIVKHQTTNVDNVSGATLTSFAIKAGVVDCLKQAGLDPKNFAKPMPKAPVSQEKVTESADVVVIGAGGAGLSAAVAAAHQGKRVIVVEKAHFAGGNTSVAGGCYNASAPDIEAKQTMPTSRRALIDGVLAEKPRNDLHKALIEKVKGQMAEYDAKKSTTSSIRPNSMLCRPGRRATTKATSSSSTSSRRKPRRCRRNLPP